MHREKTNSKKLAILQNCLIVERLLLSDILINYFSISVSIDLALSVTKEKLKHNLLNRIYSHASIQPSKSRVGTRLFFSDSSRVTWICQIESSLFLNKSESSHFRKKRKGLESLKCESRVKLTNNKV